MNVYEKLGLQPIINASDFYTIIGGSRMDKTVVDAMIEASEHFVDMVDFERKASARIAGLTNNEACHICAGAAAGILLAAAGCMTGQDVEKARLLPISKGMKNEFIVFSDQQGESLTFLHMIETAGGRMICVPADAKSMAAAINDQTAGVFYYPRINDFDGAFSLSAIIEVAHRQNVPVIVDAAAMLPPAENFWTSTRDLGADLIIFSGGKHIAGPQSTGLILGRESLVEACRINAGPNVRVGRPAKVGKEEIAGILAAVELFMATDPAERRKTQYSCLTRIESGLAGLPGVKTRIQPHGTLQQDYPLLIVTLPDGIDGNEIHQALRQGTPSIDIRPFLWTKSTDTVFINPFSMRPQDPDLIIKRLRECLVK